METKETNFNILTGIFSRKNMPGIWHGDTTGISQPILESVRQEIGEFSVIGIIPRSSDSTTLLITIHDNNKSAICQIGPSTTDKNKLLDIGLVPERSLTKVFEGLEKRVQFLKSQDILLPKVLFSKLLPQINRGLVITEQIEGTPADLLIRRESAENITRIFQAFGGQIGKLEKSSVPDKTPEDANTSILKKQKRVLEFLESKHIFSKDENDTIFEITNNNLSKLPKLPETWVHMDPFPVNWIITKSLVNFRLTLVDVRAIQIGHPWLEGIGRAIQWACRDWFTITNQQPPDFLETELLASFNTEAPREIQIPKIFNLNSLLQLEELIWLPRAIAYESLRDSPEETPDRRKKLIMQICEES